MVFWKGESVKQPADKLETSIFFLNLGPFFLDLFIKTPKSHNTTHKTSAARQW